MAQMVTSCQMPPSSSGAKASPYFSGGGATLMRHTFHVGPRAASHRISAVPTREKKMVVTPKKPT